MSLVILGILVHDFPLAIHCPTFTISLTPALASAVESVVCQVQHLSHEEKEVDGADSHRTPVGAS